MKRIKLHKRIKMYRVCRRIKFLHPATYKERLEHQARVKRVLR